ncbi:MAG TPA: shikimate kinase [Spirochaetia bacterium]|nr:shikimate kinase [Spirochaetia bacterium]
MNQPVEQRLVYLMGMKHSGKSTLGSLLASKWEVRFVDLDDWMVTRFLAAHGLPEDEPSPGIRNIYRSLGAVGFRRLEADAARALASELDESRESAVIALGGGTIENEEAMDALATRGTFVYLEEDAELLFKRIERGGIPPFLAGNDPHAIFLGLYAIRTALYRQKASIAVPLAGLPVEAAFNRLQQHLEEYLNGRQ